MDVIWISGFWISGFLVVDSQWSVSESMVNSHRVTTVSRQAVKCEARNPCIHDHDNIKSAEGTTEVFFCRTFGALIFLQSYSAGIPHCVLHHLPGNCRSYGAYLDVVETRRTQKNKHVGTYRIRPKCQRSKLGASTSSATEKKGAAMKSSSFF